MSLPSRVKFIAILLLSVAAPMAMAGSVHAHVADLNGGAVANAVVALYAANPPTMTDVAHALMDQRDKQFDPRVLAVRKNTLVSFPNSDNIRHQVYSFSPAKRFELRLYHGTPSEPVLFDVAGEVALGCNIHDHMIGYIYVVDSPYFAKTDADGNALLTDIPSGTYRAQLWFPGVLADEKGLAQSIKVAAPDTVIGFKAAAPAISPLDPKPATSDLQMLFQQSGSHAP